MDFYWNFELQWKQWKSPLHADTDTDITDDVERSVALTSSSTYIILIIHAVELINHWLFHWCK